MSVSIIIKALNEERHIARAIESALAAAPDGEVILADSGSTDRTLAIARTYPVRVVQLENTAERCCGAGPQLGFQHASGDAICLIDGDMVLDPEFIAEGLAFLAAHPDAAGVGGAVVDRVLVSIEFERRNKRGAADLRPGPVDRLNGGGLYRRAAIVQVGHFSDRNLHAYEEYDLGVRLRTAGWTLHRLARPFVDHYGHTTGGYRLLWRRARTGYMYGLGEVLRGAVGRPHLRLALADLHEIRLWLAVYCGWALGLALLITRPWPAALVLLGAMALVPVAVMAMRYRSLRLGLYATVAWNVHALGMALGFMRTRKAPDAWIDSVEIGSLSAPRANPAAQKAVPPVFVSERTIHV